MRRNPVRKLWCGFNLQPVRKIISNGVNLKIWLVMTVVLLCMSGIATAIERHVPSQYPTIQDAIDAAVNGDTVIVADGVYTPSEGSESYISFKGKAITVRSENGPENCIINAEGYWLGIFVFENGEGSNSILEGFTLKNGNNWMGGGAITCWWASPTISNCIITGNYGCEMYQVAGGIVLFDSDATISNCIIYNNKGIYFGAGAIYCGGNSGLSQPSIINCTICNNKVWYPSHSYAAGIYSTNCNPIIKNCIIWGNYPSDSQIVGTFDSVTFSNIQGTYPGQGNINTDPCFIAPDSNDFHLLPESVCIDAGDPSSEFGLEPEPDGGRINMGAYGNTPEATCKGGLVLESYNLVSKTRIGRTEFEYVYTMTLNNNSTEAVSNVVVELLDASENVSIIDLSVGFPYIAAGDSAISDDTFSIQVDRSVPVDATIISWRATFDTAGGGAGQTTFTTGIALDDNLSDITGDGEVDFEDLAKLAEQWLGPPGSPSADIAPQPDGDGIVNFLDFAKLAEEWKGF